MPCARPDGPGNLPIHAGMVSYLTHEASMISRCARTRPDLGYFRRLVRFLTALRGIAESGRTPADEKLELFRGRWRGSVDPIFAEFAY